MTQFLARDEDAEKRPLAFNYILWPMNNAQYKQAYLVLHVIGTVKHFLAKKKKIMYCVYGMKVWRLCVSEGNLQHLPLCNVYCKITKKISFAFQCTFPVLENESVLLQIWSRFRVFSIGGGRKNKNFKMRCDQFWFASFKVYCEPLDYCVVRVRCHLEEH